jgi:hypothetical protein
MSYTEWSSELTKQLTEQCGYLRKMDGVKIKAVREEGSRDMSIAVQNIALDTPIILKVLRKMERKGLYTDVVVSCGITTGRTSTVFSWARDKKVSSVKKYDVTLRGKVPIG